MISIGQYKTKLYHKGQDTYSSRIGGSFTIVFIILLMIVGVGKMISIFKTDKYNFDKSLIELDAYSSESN